MYYNKLSNMNIPINFRIFAPKFQKNQSMHFVLSYDLSATEERRTEIESRIENILANYKHIKRLSTFYIVHVSNNIEWDSIRIALTNLVNGISEKMHFIMSPLMNGGMYNGILSTGEWDEINAITNM